MIKLYILLILLLLNTNFSLKAYHVFHSKFIA